MTRKRGFTRHDITIVNRPNDTADPIYYRVKGTMQPPPEFNSIVEAPAGDWVGIEDKLEIYIREDIVNFKEVRQWFFIKDQKTYVIYGQRDFQDFGKDSYKKYVGVYRTVYDQEYPFIEPEWSQIYGAGGFIDAVDSLELAIDYKLSQVIQ